MIYEAIKKLVQYGLDTGLITEVDKIYATNQILDVMRMDEYEEPEGESGETDLESVLKELLGSPEGMVRSHASPSDQKYG